jgi:hypothetical protein
MLCLIPDQHRDVANFVTGIGVTVRFGDRVEVYRRPITVRSLPASINSCRKTRSA